jgi:hypothetical protein
LSYSFRWVIKKGSIIASGTSTSYQKPSIIQIQIDEEKEKVNWELVLLRNLA